MRHNYGANIESLLFEPIDELTFADFKVEALQTLNESISRVQVLDMYMVNSSVTDYFTDVNTTMTVAVVYRLPLAAPQIVKLNLAIPGAVNEDSPI
jgi:phage baseplate assembly protein W